MFLYYMIKGMMADYFMESILLEECNFYNIVFNLYYNNNYNCIQYVTIVWHHDWTNFFHTSIYCIT